MTDKAVLYSEMTPEPSRESEFHQWYNTEHIPIRMDVPGFTGARRYSADDGQGFLAVYEIESQDVLANPAYSEIKNNPSDLTVRMLRDVSGFTRYIGPESSARTRPGVSIAEALDAKVLYSVFFTVPEEAHTDFDDWYEQDHTPTLLECEDWLVVRRFRISVADPQPYTHMALHYLNDLSALESPARAEARASDWRARIAAEPWFKGTYRTFSLMRSFAATHGGGQA